MEFLFRQTDDCDKSDTPEFNELHYHFIA